MRSHKQNTPTFRRGVLCYNDAMKETFVVQEGGLATVVDKVLKHLTLEQPTQAKVLLLEGDLGAGKTTFTKTLAQSLGVVEPVHSPTFILKKTYRTQHPVFTHLVHIDAYRFEQPKEAKVLRLEEDVQQAGALIVVEWPSKMSYLPHDATILFDVIDDDTREITISYDKA